MKFAFATAILKTETLRMRRCFAHVLRKSTHGLPFVSHIRVAYGAPLSGPSGCRSSAKNVTITGHFGFVFEKISDREIT